MKLGEALTIRKKQATRLNDLRGRIKANALVQEGDEPQENVDTLLGEYAIASEEHKDLVLKVNKTNLQTVIDGAPLLDRLATREDLIRKRNTLALAVESASPSRNDYRFMRTEIKFVPQVDVTKLRTNLDAISKEITTLDLLIQQKNWETDLVE